MVPASRRSHRCGTSAPARLPARSRSPPSRWTVVYHDPLEAASAHRGRPTLPLCASEDEGLHLRPTEGRPGRRSGRPGDGAHRRAIKSLDRLRCSDPIAAGQGAHVRLLPSRWRDGQAVPRVGGAPLAHRHQQPERRPGCPDAVGSGHACCTAASPWRVPPRPCQLTRAQQRASLFHPRSSSAVRTRRRLPRDAILSRTPSTPSTGRYERGRDPHDARAVTVVEF